MSSSARAELRRLMQLPGHERGAVVIESLVAFLPIFLFFIGILQTADGYAAQLIVRRAASAAARAAVVVLPDDGFHYGDAGNRGRDRYQGRRQREIEDAAKLVLEATDNLSNPSIRVSGRHFGHEPTTVKVAADYRCLLGVISVFCGRSRSLRLSASATLPYQGAPYAYEP